MLRSVERGYFLSSEGITDRHVATEEEMATLPFFTEFLASQNLAWFAANGHFARPVCSHFPPEIARKTAL